MFVHVFLLVSGEDRGWSPCLYVYAFVSVWASEDECEVANRDGDEMDEVGDVCVHAALLVSRAQWHASHCMYWGEKVTSEYLPAACIKSHRCASLHQKNQQARVEIWRKTSSLHCASFYMKDVNLKVQRGEMNNKKKQNKKIIIEKPVLTWHLFRHLLFFIFLSFQQITSAWQ